MLLSDQSVVVSATVSVSEVARAGATSLPPLGAALICTVIAARPSPPATFVARSVKVYIAFGAWK